jgi:cell shape-determining protein MreC
MQHSVAMADVSDMRDNFQGEKNGLVEWIEKVRDKKREFEERATENLRLEAILNSALRKSVSLLRARQQQQRLERFKLLREKTLRKRVEITSARPELMEFYPTKRMKIHVEQ